MDAVNDLLWDEQYCAQGNKMQKFIIHTQDLVFYTNYAEVVKNRLVFQGIMEIGYSVRGEGEFCCHIDLIKYIEKEGIVYWHRNQSEEKLKKIFSHFQVLKNDYS